MQPCKILIADDEPIARHAVKFALPGPGYEYNIIESGDGAETIAKIRERLPDIIFLDVQMPLYSGLEILQLLPVNYHPYIVIISAHDNFALNAFEHDASDYLLKPFTQSRFDKAFRKAWDKWQAGKVREQISTIDSLSDRLQKMLSPNGYKSRLSIKDGAKIFVVPCDDIIFIEAEGSYTAVHTTNRKYLHNETLNTLETTLDPALFTRIHRSSIVNTRYIKELISHYNGDYTIVMQNGNELKLSRNYREKLLQLIG